MRNICADQGRALSQFARRLDQNQLGFVAAPSTECGQPRHAWSDHVEISKSPEKSIRLSECGRAWANRLHMRHGDRADGQGAAHAAQSRAGGRCLGGERRTNSGVGRASTRTTTQQCNNRTAKAAPCMCLRHADGDGQRDSTNFWSFIVLQHSRDGRAVRFDAGLDEIQFLPKRVHVGCSSVYPRWK